MTVRDCIKGGAQLATHWKAQSVLLGGLHNFYKTTKDKAIAFTRRYPLTTPQEYMQTTDGMILKASSQNLHTCNDNSINHNVDTKFRISTEFTIQESIKYATTEIKLRHIFDKDMHKLKPLLDKMNGDKKKIISDVITALINTNALPIAGKIENFPISIHGYTIHVRGFIDNGIIKIGTMFIP